MNYRKLVVRGGLLLLLVGAGLWMMLSLGGPQPEDISRLQALQALAPGGSGQLGDAIISDSNNAVVQSQSAEPAVVNLADIESRPAEVDQFQQQLINGERDNELNDGPLTDSVFARLVEESLDQAEDRTVQSEMNALNGTLNIGANFKSIDYTQSQQGVPPDPDIMVGNTHVVVGVNTSFQVFDKAGNSLVGPTLYSDFWGSNCGSGATVTMFDPWSAYDESTNRYILGITAFDAAINGGDNGWACIAVSQTDSATGSWFLYSFDGNPGGGADYFFDYPHIGVGQDAIYMGANMFGASFVRNHIFAFDKAAMYAGTSANYVKLNVGTSNFTLQPAKIKGFGDGGWPTNPNEPHYFIDSQFGNNQNTLTVWQFNDPFGSASLTVAGTVNVNSYSLPVSQPQLGGSNIQGNDNRLLDVEYWGGRMWANHTVGCNPGGGTVNCIRWYEIDISSGSPSLVQQGTLGTSGTYRSFPDLGVNRCGDMMVGYTMTSSSMYPSVYVSGREASDPAGQLKQESLVKAGEDFYTAYDSVPRRWGDYTGMALDPDGVTFWYVGEYSRNQATARWSTWVGSFTWSDCPAGGPTPTPPPSPTATNTPEPTPVPDGLFCSTGTTTIPTSGNASNTINISDARNITDLNVSINADHTWVGDLTFSLVHNDTGTSVTLIDRPGVPASTYGCSSDDLLVMLDDEAASGIENVCSTTPPALNGTFQPTGSLADFDGEGISGSWTLNINDAVSPDGGTLNEWCVEATLTGATPTDTPVPPTATNTPLPTATNTPLPTATNTPPPAPTDTPPPAPTDTPVPTATNTPLPTANQHTRSRWCHNHLRQLHERW